MRKAKRTVLSKPPISDAERKRQDDVHRNAPQDERLNRQARAAQQQCDGSRREFSQVMASLKQAREAAGISIRELEARSGIARGNLSLLENGKGNPTLQTVRKIADAIGVKVTIQISEPASR